MWDTSHHLSIQDSLRSSIHSWNNFDPFRFWCRLFNSLFIVAIMKLPTSSHWQESWSKKPWDKISPFFFLSTWIIKFSFLFHSMILQKCRETGFICVKNKWGVFLQVHNRQGLWSLPAALEPGETSVGLGPAQVEPGKAPIEPEPSPGALSGSHHWFHDAAVYCTLIRLWLLPSETCPASPRDVFPSSFSPHTT